MFGKYKYGSEKLNISFNPEQESELASYNFDDDGTPAQKKYLIQNGLLKKPIGSFYSAQRAEQDYVACSRLRVGIDRLSIEWVILTWNQAILLCLK